MSSKRFKKKQLQEKQFLEDKKFRKHLIVGFSVLLTGTIITLIFFTYWCETKYTYRKFVLYGKEIPFEMVCMNDNSLQHHESSKIVIESKAYYMCSLKCQSHINKHFKEVAYTTDAFSGDTICKADALIGLKERGKPGVIYFKNNLTFKYYYAK